MASTPTRDLQEEFLAATRKSQETVVRAIKTWVETVRTVTPKLPSVYAPLADRLPKLPSVTDRLLKPEDVVASSYDFAEHLLALQRQFAEDLLKVTEPLIPGNGQSHAPAAKSAPKAALAASATPKTEFRRVAGVSEPKAPVAESAPKVPAAVSESKAVVPETAPKGVVAEAAPKGVVAEAAPKTVAVPTAPKAPAAKSAPKPATAKPGPKATPAPRTPRSAAAKSAQKPPTARPAPKSTGTN